MTGEHESSDPLSPRERRQLEASSDRERVAEWLVKHFNDDNLPFSWYRERADELLAWLRDPAAQLDTRPATDRERWEAVVIDAFHKWNAVQRANDRNTNGILGATWMPWSHIRTRLLKSDLRGKP